MSVAEEFSSSWETDKADAWFEECESIASELDSAWEVVYFARESRRGNPRMRSGAFRSTARVGTPKDSPSIAGYEDILARANEGVSHLLHLARTLREASQGLITSVRHIVVVVDDVASSRNARERT